MKLVQDNPASMFQICQEFLSDHNRPVFVVIERADLLFKKLPDCVGFFLGKKGENFFLVHSGFGH